MGSKKLTEALASRDWWSDLLDRVIRTGVQGYAAGWIALGADYNSLFSVEPLKGSLVAVVMCVLFSLGATQVGTPTSASFTDSSQA